MGIPHTGQGRENGSDDGAITPQQLVAELMTAIHSIGSQAKFAARKGVSQSLVSLTVTGKRGIDESIANALGYIKRVRVEYVPIRQGVSPATLPRDTDDTRQEPGTERIPGDDLSSGDKPMSAAEPGNEGSRLARRHGDVLPAPLGSLRNDE